MFFFFNVSFLGVGRCEYCEQRFRFLKMIVGPNVKFMIPNSILTMQRHRPNVNPRPAGGPKRPLPVHFLIFPLYVYVYVFS